MDIGKISMLQPGDRYSLVYKFLIIDVEGETEDAEVST